jgi:hypothetical protein
MVMKSYEAIYDHGQMKWLKEKPDIGKARVIVTILTNEEGRLLPASGGTPLSDLAGGLEHSARFAGSPLKIQEILRNDWD